MPGMYHRHYRVSVKLAGLPTAATDYRVMIAQLALLPDHPTLNRRLLTLRREEMIMVFVQPRAFLIREAGSRGVAPSVEFNVGGLRVRMHTLDWRLLDRALVDLVTSVKVRANRTRAICIFDERSRALDNARVLDPRRAVHVF